MPADSTEPKTKGKWPTGMTFVMYCGGVSLLLLTVYIIISKKDFNLDAQKGTLSTINAGTSAPVNGQEAEQKKEQLKQQFDQAKTQTASMESGIAGEGANSADSFNGMWSIAGSGSSYTIEQNGSTIVLAEMTNGEISAFGSGTVNGIHAALTIQAVESLPYQIQLTLEGSQIKLLAPTGETYYMTKL